MLPIKGLQKTTLVDYPGKIASTIFIGGCNFRCPFCHNATLVLDPEQHTTIPEDELLEYYAGRTNQLEGICITGGEPTLAKDLPQFISKLKKQGYAIKLDTNGTNPEMIKELLANNLLDYIAMDIKAPESLYNAACGVDVDIEKIKESIELLKGAKIEYEFRTTVVPEFVPLEKAQELGSLISGSKKHFLQQFESKMGTIDPSFEDKKGYETTVMHDLAKSLEGYAEKISFRGVV